MNRRYLGRLLGLTMALSCSATEVSHAEPVEVFRAKAAMENKDMQAAVRKKLGCGQCSDVTAAGSSGTQIHYTVSPSPSLSIELHEIRAAVIQEVRGEDEDSRVFQLMFELSNLAKQNLASVASLPADYGANYYEGKLLGVGPLVAFDAYYVVGFFGSKSEAIEAAGMIGLEASFVPYDKERHQQVRKQMLEGNR